MAPPLSFAGGLLLGFASSLHCVGMCGGIALLLGRPTASSRRPFVDPLVLHAGRITAYMAFGGVAGAVGSTALDGLDGALAHQLLRWAAAMTLAWVGLSTMGLMPSPALIGHAVQARLPRPALALRLPGELRGYAAGLGWGLMPCGMVYGALLYAMFAGSLPGGMLVMAGFGLGTGGACPSPCRALDRRGGHSAARRAEPPARRGEPARILPQLSQHVFL